MLPRKGECSTEKELFQALKSMPYSKSPGNDGITKWFWEMFWSKVKNDFYYVFYTLFVKKNLYLTKASNYKINRKEIRG